MKKLITIALLLLPILATSQVRDYQLERPDSVNNNGIDFTDKWFIKVAQDSNGVFITKPFWDFLIDSLGYDTTHVAGSGYWTLNGGDLYNNSGDSIGINVTDPRVAFEIGTPSSSSTPFMRLSKTTNQDYFSQWSIEGTHAQAMYLDLDVNSNSSFDDFKIRHNSGLTTMFHIDNAAKVGFNGDVDANYRMVLHGLRNFYMNPEGVNSWYGIGLEGSVGGWINEYTFLGSGGTELGGFGANGANDAMTKWYIGAWGTQMWEFYEATGVTRWTQYDGTQTTTSPQTIIVSEADGDIFEASYQQIADSLNNYANHYWSLNGDTLYNNSGIVLDITNDIIDFDNLRFDIAPVTPYTTEGSFYWDATDHTIAIKNDESDVTLQVGQESYIRVYNNSGLTINNGQVVYIVGTEVTEHRPTIDLARSDAKITSEVIGFATHSIENNTYGYVTAFGMVNDLNTSAFSAGDIVYLDETTAGAIRATPPPEGNYEVFLGYVVRSDAVNGKVLAMPNPDLGLPQGDANELVLYVEKGSVGTINAGQAVYVTGYDLGSDRVEVELADASSIATMPVFGIAREAITQTSEGAVVIAGRLINQVTSGYSVGDILYISTTAGALTDVRPTGTAKIEEIGLVIRSHPTQGIIEVFGTGVVEDLPNIPQHNFWTGDASNYPIEQKISTLTEEVSPTTGDWIFGEVSTGEMRKYNVGNINIDDADSDPLNEAWTIDGDDADTEQITNQTWKFEGAGGITTDVDPVSDKLIIDGSGVGGGHWNDDGTYLEQVDQTQAIEIHSISGFGTNAMWDANGQAPVTGSYNVGIGHNVLVAMTAGTDYNIALGEQAGEALNGGDYNFVAGYQAGHLMSSGSQNIAIGREASATISTAGNTVALGAWALEDNTANFCIAVGYQAGRWLRTGIDAIAIGREALKGQDGISGGDTYNIGIGYQAGMDIQNGDYNVAIGYQALMNVTIEQGSVAIGRLSQSGTSGSAITNTSVGMFSLEDITGDGNVAMGENAGRFHTASTFNTFIGQNAGEGADGSSTGSSYNVAVGKDALSSITTGGYNVSIGYQAGDQNLTGSNNVFIGKNSGQGETGSDKLWIENSTETNPLIWGDFILNDLVYNAQDVLLDNSAITTNSLLTFRMKTDGGEWEHEVTGVSGTYRFQPVTTDEDFEFTDESNDPKIFVEAITDDVEIGGNRTPDYKLDVWGTIGNTAGSYDITAGDDLVSTDDVLVGDDVIFQSSAGVLNFGSSGKINDSNGSTGSSGDVVVRDAGGVAHSDRVGVAGLPYCELSMSGKQTLGAGAWATEQTVDFSLVNIEEGGDNYFTAVAGNDDITIESTGEYRVDFKLSFEDGDPKAMLVYLENNTTRLTGGQFSYTLTDIVPNSGSGLSVETFTGHWEGTLNAGDDIFIRLLEKEPAHGHPDVFASSNQRSTFTITKIQ
jgi:hypothetical protein